MSKIVRLGIAKIGCLGSLPILEFLLDERAERDDIDVRVVGSGAKVGKEQSIEVVDTLLKLKPDLIVLAGPAQQAPGPREARRILSDSKIPTLVISDGPLKRLTEELEGEGLGYIVVETDPLIGARREFLDPVEMALFNSDVIRVLACTGVLNVIVDALDSLIEAIKRGESPELPRMIIDKDAALSGAGYKNPYAEAKAKAAHEISRYVARLNIEACFKIKDWKKYISLTAAGHEMVRYASKLADEARELEKSENTVLRRPHHDDGIRGEKRNLIEKPLKNT